jgi:hypothetical protein
MGYGEMAIDTIMPSTAVLDRARPSIGTEHQRRAVSQRLAGAGRRVDGVRTRGLGLEFDPGTSFETWKGLGLRIAKRADTTTWWLADWVAFGEGRFGERYRAAVDATGLDYQTLRNYAVVARRFEVSRRRDKLSFQHHAEVSALPEADQEHWLDLAAANGWSRTELRKQLRARESGQAARATTVLRVSVEPTRKQGWSAAAERAGCSLEEWIVRSLDAAAAESEPPERV